MRKSIKIVTPPEKYPVESRGPFGMAQMCRIDESNPGAARDLMFLDDLIAAATESIEEYCSRAFITQTVELICVPEVETMSSPAGLSHAYEILPQTIKLWRSPVQQVCAIEAIAPPNVVHEQPDDLYYFNGDADPAEVSIWYGGWWVYYLGGYYRIRYKAGYGDNAEDVPAKIRQAIRLTVAQWYAQRENLDYTLPPAALALLDGSSYRIDASQLTDVPFTPTLI